MVVITWLTSYLAATLITFILGGYFLREFSHKRLRASLVWSLGFLLYGISQLGHVFARIMGGALLGKPLLGLLIMPMAFSIALFYYGTSLLFLKPHSFFQGRFTILLLVVYIVYIGGLILFMPLEKFVETPSIHMKGLCISYAVVFFVTSVFFLHGSWRFQHANSIKIELVLVSLGWFLAFIDVLYLGLFIRYSHITDTIINLVHAGAWVLLLIGMTMVKTTMKTLNSHC